MAFFGAQASAAPASSAPAPAAGGDDQAMDAEAAAILRDEATAYDVLGVDRGAGPTADEVDGMTVAKLKAALAAAGETDASGKKADLKERLLAKLGL